MMSTESNLCGANLQTPTTDIHVGVTWCVEETPRRRDSFACQTQMASFFSNFTGSSLGKRSNWLFWGVFQGELPNSVVVTLAGNVAWCFQ